MLCPFFTFVIAEHLSGVWIVMMPGEPRCLHDVINESFAVFFVLAAREHA